MHEELKKIKQNIPLVSDFNQKDTDIRYLLVVLLLLAILHDVGYFISTDVEKDYAISFFTATIIGFATVIYSVLANFSVKILGKEANFKKTLNICIYSLTPLVLIGLLFVLVGMISHIIEEKSPAGNAVFTAIMLILTALTMLIFVNL